jgi:hypothetical protein
LAFARKLKFLSRLLPNLALPVFLHYAQLNLGSDSPGHNAALDRQIPAFMRARRNDSSGRAAGYGHATTCLLPAAGRASLSRYR